MPPTTVEVTPVATPPLSLPAATLEIDGQSYLLPPMVLRFHAVEGGAELLLSGRADAEATGNTLVLSMSTTATTLDELATTPWTFAAGGDEWTETTQGLSLEEERYVLRPYEITVGFAPGGGAVKIDLRGTMLKFDTAAGADLPGKKVSIAGEFEALLNIK